MPAEFGPWATVYGRFRVWRNAGVFTALLEGLIAEGARAGKVDLSLVSVDSTTVRAHHDAAGMRVSKHLMQALEEAAQERETARQKGADRRNRTDRPSAEPSGADASDLGGDRPGDSDTGHALVQLHAGRHPVRS
jgi:transposase